MLQETDAPASCRVLLVEDKLDGRATLRNLLELWGYKVETAADGRQGVEKGLAWRPDVAVLDIGLPGLDGYEVARRLRAALGGRLVLIALTGYGSPEDKQRAFDAGFDRHLTKPADPGELLRLLRPA
jgi:two-component system, sensor histidine kinase